MIISARRGINKSHTGFLILVCFTASLGGILFGFDTAVISGTVSMVESQFELNKLLVGWFGSSALVGAIIGSMISGVLSDKYGRRPMLILSAILFFFSALASAIAPSFAILIAARLVGGLGIGMASVLAPMYISEFSPPKIRGRLVALYQLSIVMGILLAYFSNWGLSEFARNYADDFGGQGFLHRIMISEVWRGMFGAEIIPAVLFFSLLLIIPESPRWLIKEGREKDGYEILVKLSGETAAKADLKAIHESVTEEQGTFGELFKGGFKLALIAGLGLSVFGQFTGVNIIVYYGPDILRDAGFNFDNALKYQISIGLINLIFTSLALWKIDHWGRRKLLIGGMIAVCISLLIIGMQFSMAKTPGIWLVIMLCIYMASLAFSINAVIWVLLGEIYPNRLRGKAMSVATFANWATNFATAFLFPWFVAQIGMNSGFFVFAGFCFIAVIFFHKVVPETKGKTLEEIEEHWKKQEVKI